MNIFVKTHRQIKHISAIYEFIKCWPETLFMQILHGMRHMMLQNISIQTSELLMPAEYGFSGIRNFVESQKARNKC